MDAIALETLDGGTRELGTADLEALANGMQGDLVRQDDAEYDEVRQIWNAMIDRRPGLIARCAATADVEHVMRFARTHELLVSVRGGGHNIAGNSLCDEALLIDLSPMKTVTVDAEARRATAGPGATLGDLDAATQVHGLATPTGINSTTGVAGLTLGGGFGWLSRSLGLTVDNLVSAEVVTADGERLTCDAQAEPDLFWAIRGGGGNFGIVTAFTYALHSVGPEVMSGPVVYDGARAAEILRGYRDACAASPEALTVWAVLRGAPPMPFLAPEVHGTPVVLLPGLYNGPMEEAAAAFAPFRALGEPVGDAFGPHPFAGFQQAFDPLLTPGARNYWKSHNFTELSDGLIDTLADFAGRLPSPQSEIFIAQLGGATNRVAADATAYPHRDAEFVMNVHTRWEDPAYDADCVGWAREFYAATLPFATGGVYVNFISDDEDRVAGAYGPNYDRLARVKADYDPDNVFRVNQNVRPTA